MVREIKSLAFAEGTSLRTSSGIADFSRGLRLIVSKNGIQVVLFITFVYLCLQTFCIPGTVVLNAALGAIMGTLLAVPFCTFLGTIGALCCYTLSSVVGISLVESVDSKLMQGKGLHNIRTQVNQHRKNLFIYILFLRLTPFLPNWLVNLASPIVGVPASTLAAATFVGIIPQTYLSVRFGALARQNQSSDNKESKGQIITLWDTLLIAVIALTLVAIVQLKKRFISTVNPTCLNESEVNEHDNIY
ncbi:unnamed protein product [Phytomonas sp. EM1]|nr:unnamed protein product [Phytomonas sp. EM1]|eukprot:CCW63017.1 unnamed protein product [Phytomonas sp. isolate EM1]